MNPLKICIFFLIVLAPLALLSWFSKEGTIQIAGIDFSFISTDNLINSKIAKPKSIAKFVEKVDTTIVDEVEKVDSTKLSGGANRMGAPSQIVGKVSTTNFPIYGNEAGFRFLHRFFEKLENVSRENKKIRIMHYGDSQLEGDRITAFFRNRVQTRFGGSGPGTVPMINVYETNSFTQKYSSNFTRYTSFGGPRLKSNAYGQMVSVGRFTKEISDSATIATTKSLKTAWIEISANPLALGRAKNFNEVYLHYGNVVKQCIAKVYEGNTLILIDTLICDKKYHCLALKFPSTPGKIKIEFSAAISPDFYGISLEGTLGVQVDNVAMRGSSGDWVGKNSTSLLSTIYDQQNVGLIIMQYGGNQVPYFKDSMSVVRYGNLFKSQLYRLRKLRPDVAILVLGPSDMSKFSQGTYQTYPLLEQCIAEMKKVALETGSVYWDLYAAMGGENSMPEWVNQGLAGKDYIHFSPRGSSIASQLFTDSFFTAFEQWKETK
jgi:hypothetical protein